MQDYEWGDWRDWKDWRERKAEIIGQDIRGKNGGTWPQTVSEWKETAARYGLKLYILNLPLSCSALTVDNVVVIRHVSKPELLHRRICHEIAEAVTKRESSLRPFCFTSSRNEHHHVARLVEQEAYCRGLY